MRGFWPRATGVITALIVAYGFASASANPLTPFRYKSQAQRHCPADVIVWLDLGKGIYYSKRQRRYGRGFYRKFYVPGGSSQQRLSPLVAQGCDKDPTKRTPSRSSAQGSCGVRWTT